jgi:hypothetical protein
VGSFVSHFTLYCDRLHQLAIYLISMGVVCRSLQSCTLQNYGEKVAISGRRDNSIPSFIPRPHIEFAGHVISTHTVVYKTRNHETFSQMTNTLNNRSHFTFVHRALHSRWLSIGSLWMGNLGTKERNDPLSPYCASNELVRSRVTQPQLLCLNGSKILT